MFRPQLVAAVAALAALTSVSAQNVRIVAPSVYREGIQIPVRLEQVKGDGSIMKQFWLRNGWLETSGGGTPTETNSVSFRNGVALMSVAGRGTNDVELKLIDPVMGITNRVVRAASSEELVVGGTLTGSATTWSGVVRITNDVTVPTGHTLRIEAGTLVLVEGVSEGTTAADLVVSGSIESLGTAEQPVWITSTSEDLNWGQILHTSGSRGEYRYTFIHKGGRADGEGHTETGPVLRLSGSEVRLEQCVVSEIWNGDEAIGKGMYARNSELVLDSTIFARMRMGPEIEGTSLLCTNSYFMEMRGPDDGDGIYLKRAEGKSIQVVDSVFMGGDDDAVDTLDSEVVIRDCIFREWWNEAEGDGKAISTFNGRVEIERCLIADCFAGVWAKAEGGEIATVFINQSTIVTKTNGVAASWKSNAIGPAIDIHVTNSIVQAEPAIFSNFGTTNVLVGYSIVSTPWDGLGGSVADPGFADLTNHDYRLSSGSPAIDFGDPAAEPDEDGSRADAGYAAYRRAIADVRLDTSKLSISIPEVAFGYTVVTERSHDFKTWTEAGRWVARQSTFTFDSELEGQGQFFRFRIE